MNVKNQAMQIAMLILLGVSADGCCRFQSSRGLRCSESQLDATFKEFSPAEKAAFEAMIGTPAEKQLDDLAIRFNEHVDPLELIRWAKEYRSSVVESARVVDLPRGVAMLQPKFSPVVGLDEFDNVRIYWGGGLGHWGLYIRLSDVDPGREIGRAKRVLAEGVFGFVSD
jgi:hypothetical protein